MENSKDHKAAAEPPLDCRVGLDEHECPNCGWRITHAAFIAAKFDFDCPRCGIKTISEFNIAGGNNYDINGCN